jgi:glycosyltransferase involved in cell wall biosynthesis
MRVLGITDHLGNVGGAEISTKTILEGLAAHQATESVTVVGMDSSEASRLDFTGVNVIPVDPLSGMDSLPDLPIDFLVQRRLARTVRRHMRDVDVIHAHHRRSILALRHLDPDCPTIGTIRDFWPVCPISIYHVDCEQCTGCEDRLDDCLAYQDWDGLTEPLRRRYLLAKRAHNRRGFVPNHAVFIADHLRERVAESMTIPSSSVIYNPVSIDRDPVQECPSQPTFVTASTLSKEKGVPTAIDAMKRVHEYLPDARLLVFGEGPLEDDLQKRANDLPSEAIDFRGRVPPDELYGAMATATATVFPSEWDEPFGRVTVESLALGTPVVGSRVGGIAEIIDDGETGLLFPPADSDALAGCLLTLVNDPKTWNRLSTAGIGRATDFSVDQIVSDHLTLYHELLNSDDEVK